MGILLKWLASTLSIIIAAYLLPGVMIDSLFAAFVAALILGIVNTLVKPVLLLLTLPITILTFGLFAFVVNALMVMLTSWIVQGFGVDGFWWALGFSIVLSLINYFLYQVIEE